MRRVRKFSIIISLVHTFYLKDIMDVQNDNIIIILITIKCKIESIVNLSKKLFKVFIFSYVIFLLVKIHNIYKISQ